MKRLVIIVPVRYLLCWLVVRRASQGDSFQPRRTRFLFSICSTLSLLSCSLVYSNVRHGFGISNQLCLWQKSWSESEMHTYFWLRRTILERQTTNQLNQPARRKREKVMGSGTKATSQTISQPHSSSLRNNNNKSRTFICTKSKKCYIHIDKLTDTPNSIPWNEVT